MCALREHSGFVWDLSLHWQWDSCVNLKVEHWQSSRYGIPWLPSHTGFTLAVRPTQQLSRHTPQVLSLLLVRSETHGSPLQA